MDRFFFYILSTILLISSCNQKIGGKCEYETVVEYAGVSEIALNEQGIDFVMLSGGDASSVYSYKLMTDEIEKFPKIDFQRARQESKSLELKVEKITKGSCVPYTIIEIKML